MAVSSLGQNLLFGVVRRTAVGVVVAFVVVAYLVGPRVSPPLHDAAVARCNDYAQGNWRSFRLSWDVGVRPHWTCWDASRPQRDPIDLGWWTSPFRAAA